MTIDDALLARCAGQLELDLGDLPAPPERPLLDVSVVVCHVCTGHHPVERCPGRVVCSLCTGGHHSSAHLTGGA